MPQTVEAEIRTARRIPGAIPLGTVGRITAGGHGTCNRSRLIERDERNTSIVRGAVIIGVAVAVVAGVIRVVVAIIVWVIATCRYRGAGRDPCRRSADGKAGIAP